MNPQDQQLWIAFKQSPAGVALQTAEVTKARQRQTDLQAQLDKLRADHQARNAALQKLLAQAEAELADLQSQKAVIEERIQVVGFAAVSGINGQMSEEHRKFQAAAAPLHSNIKEAVDLQKQLTLSD